MSETHDKRLRHPIGVVVRRTGLSQAALRAWERRYEAVVPDRSEGGHRLYSDEDVQRLMLLRRLVEGGRNISQVANLPLGELRELLRSDLGASPDADPEEQGATGDDPGSEGDPEEILKRALIATRHMDGERLNRILIRSAVVLRPGTLVTGVLVPLLARIGELWEKGRLGVAQEHLASGVIRRFLEWLIEAGEVGSGAPVMLTCTPQGQRHEFGALIAGAVAAERGWKVVNLGPDLPAEEIAAAAGDLDARAVVVSAIFGGADGVLADELTRLRALLPPEIRLLAGGPAVDRVADELAGDGIELPGDVSGLPEA